MYENGYNTKYLDTCSQNLSTDFANVSNTKIKCASCCFISICLNILLI